ncbi:MAG: hypothetical protein ACSHW1_20510 [Yoonia sp.]|uniref:hypothetical protein n=1 Tax=Yoonia sp. TaxID=2212373 RepID=UPI003EF2F49D
MTYVADHDSIAFEVRSTQTLTKEQISGFGQLDLSAHEVVVGANWQIPPSALKGRTSAKNAEGWTVTRKDLPKYTKTFCHDTPNYGDASRGWSTVCRDREVYHKDVFLAVNHEIIISVEEEHLDGRFGVRFTLSENFDRTSGNFEVDLLFGLNVLQENFGSAEVSVPNAPRHYVTEILDWELFPPGNVEAVINSLKQAGRLTTPDVVEVARNRLRLFEKYEPTNYLRGLSGNDAYIGAKFADDLVVFESTKYGNAMYLLYVNWEDLSTRPRSELLRLAGNEVDRIVHRGAWENEFRGLMRKKLRERGIRLRLRR